MYSPQGHRESDMTWGLNNNRVPNDTLCSCSSHLCFPFLMAKYVACLCYHILKVKVKSLSRVQLFATPWTVAHQAPPSMGFSRQECWSGLPFPSPWDLPNPGLEPESSAL